MELSYRGSSLHRCTCCDQPYLRVWAFVHQDDEPFAVYYATNFNHTTGPETFIDVVFGTWGRNTVADHVTFGCRVGPHSSPEFWEPCVASPPSAVHGRLLSAEEAKRHEWRASFWTVVDVVLSADPAVVAHLNGQHEQLR